MFFSYTSVQEGEVFIENSTTSKVISEGTIQFHSHDDTSLLFKAFVMLPNQGTIPSLLESYMEKS